MMAMSMSLEEEHEEYLPTPQSSFRDGAPQLSRHHSTPSWGVQTPTPQFYYTSAADMYREFSGRTDTSYPNTPVSEGVYPSQYVVDSPPHSANSSPQSSSVLTAGTITPEMLRTISAGMPPSPMATPPE